jgi:kynurenine formamidase
MEELGVVGRQADTVDYQLIDLTMPISPQMLVSPCHFAPEVSQYGQRATDGWVASRLVISSHTGTHLDAPSHFIDGGRTVDQVPPKQLMGRAQVIRLDRPAKRQPIYAEQLPPIVAPRVLICTNWSDLSREPDEYFNEYPFLDVSAARALLATGVVLVGIDGPSVDYDGATHVELLGTGAVVIENLVNLSKLPELCDVSMLPIPFVGVDGSPVRAVAVTMQP